MTFENPVPVVVGLISVATQHRAGLLVIRRAIPPGKGLLALPGGFLEKETWQEGLSREVREETGVQIAPLEWLCFDFASSEPDPNRLLLFGHCVYELDIDEVDSELQPNEEVEEIGLIFRPDGLDGQIAFPLHHQRMERFLLQDYISGVNSADFEKHMAAKYANEEGLPKGFVPIGKVKDLE